MGNYSDVQTTTISPIAFVGHASVHDDMAPRRASRAGMGESSKLLAGEVKSVNDTNG